MIDMIKDAILQLATDHWQTVVFLLGGLAVAGMAIGSLKNLVVWLLTASVKAGDKGTAAVLGDKRLRMAVPAVLLLLAVATQFMPKPEAPTIRHQPAPTPAFVAPAAPMPSASVQPTHRQIVQPPPPEADAKCEFCAALHKLDDNERELFICGGCEFLLSRDNARERFSSQRAAPLSAHNRPPFPPMAALIRPVVRKPVGKDPIPRPINPTAAQLEYWEEQVNLYRP